MRFKPFALAAILAALAMTLAPGYAAAQDAASPVVSLPKRPVPYTQLRPKRTAPARPVAAGLPQVLPSGPLASAQPVPPAALEAFVDGLVRDAMAREHIAGITVAVVQNGQVVLKKGYGFASLRRGQAVNPDRTLFRIGSISKTFTWITLMKEVEAGRIHLDRPINLYLPEKVQIRDQGYDAPVRVAHLMDHSGGFEDRALGHLFEHDFERVRPLELYLRQERPRRVHAPGAVSSYSNYGVGLAGEAVTYTSGKTFERLAEDEIFLPLGMRRTTFREPHRPKAGLPAPMPDALARDVADGYRWTPEGFRLRPYEHLGHIAPAGSASSTAGDMARYMLMLLGGGQLEGVTIYGPRTAQAFRTPIRSTPRGVNGWAHGFATAYLPGGHRAFGHEGATLSFLSNMVTVPELGLGVFIATNTETGGPLARRFPAEVVRQFYGRPTVFPRPGSPALARDASAFEGYYVTTRRAYRGLEGFVGQLIGGAQVHGTPEGRLLTVSGEGTRIWSPDGPLGAGGFVSAFGDEHLAFRMSDGYAASYQTAGGAALMERAPLWRQPFALGVLSVLTGVASLITFVGLALRNRREFRENAIQSRASLIQNIQAALWLISLALFALWASKTGDVAQVMYRWPGALLVTASACALVAAALTLLTLAALPAVWRGGRRVDSWRPLRRASYTVTLLIYSAFSVLLGLWGALSPWSG